MKRFALFLRPDSDVARIVAEDLRRILQERYSMEETSLSEADLVFVIGGDGTFLHAMMHNIRGLIFPIKLGRVGFFYEVDVTNFRQYLKRFFEEQRYRIATYPKIEFMGFECVNEHYITSKNSGKVISAAVYIDGELYRKGLADGVMISTPLASTAYSLSAGGPLLDPKLKAAILNVVNPLGGPIPSVVLSDPAKAMIEVYPTRWGQKLVSDGVDRMEFNEIIIEKPRRGKEFSVIRFGDTGIKRVIRAWTKLTRQRYHRKNSYGHQHPRAE